MTVPTVLVVVFTACALGLSAFALFVSWGARRDARQALQGVRAVAARLPRKRPPVEDEPRVERREENAGPPEGQPERRRHRAPETGRYSRLRASADAREAAEPEREPATPSGSSSANVDDRTAAIPAVRPGELPETVEHPAPSTRFRTPPPPLPRPGSIGRPQ